jgi:hypothetical protein
MATERKQQAAPPATQPAAQAIVASEGERSLYFTQADEARKAWKRAEGAGYNLLGDGSFVLANIPEGFAVAMNILRLDPRGMEEGGETYKVAENKLGLAKSALFKFAGIAGVNWCPGESGRVDDASIEAYVHWRAVAEMRDVMTGQIRKIESDKVIDLRPGSALYKLWQRQSEERARKWKKPADAIFQRRLEEFMPHICSMAETKAQLRVVRAALGIQSGYSAATVAKPFVLPVLVVAPETIKDPVLRDRMIEARLTHAMGIGRILYPQSKLGPGPLASPIAPTPPPPIPPERIAPQSEKQAPPAEPETVVEADDMEDLGTGSEPESGPDQGTT